MRFGLENGAIAAALVSAFRSEGEYTSALIDFEGASGAGQLGAMYLASLSALESAVRAHYELRFVANTRFQVEVSIALPHSVVERTHYDEILLANPIEREAVINHHEAVRNFASVSLGVRDLRADHLDTKDHHRLEREQALLSKLDPAIREHPGLAAVEGMQADSTWSNDAGTVEP